MPSSGIMRTRSASEGIVWTTPATARRTAPNVLRRAAATPRGTATRIEVLGDVATDAPRPALASGPPFHPEGRGEEAGRHDRLGNAVHLGARVETLHVPCGDAPFEDRERRQGGSGAPRQIQSIEEHGAVPGEMPQVVLENFQVVIGDL